MKTIQFLMILSFTAGLGSQVFAQTSTNRTIKQNELIKTEIMKTPKETLELFLANTTNPDVIKSVVDPNATYISLNFNNPELQKILPWTGTHHEGAKGFIDTFAGVNEFWTIQDFAVQDIFSEGEKVAVFGTFTYTSKTLNKKVTSPFSILAKVKDGKIYHFMFMEDTFATAGSFRITPAGTFHSNPKNKEFKL